VNAAEIHDAEAVPFSHDAFRERLVPVEIGIRVADAARRRHLAEIDDVRIVAAHNDAGSALAGGRDLAEIDDRNIVGVGRDAVGEFARRPQPGEITDPFAELAGGQRILIEAEGRFVGEVVDWHDSLPSFPPVPRHFRGRRGGLPRVVELFEARRPAETAVMSEIDGTVTLGAISKGKRKLIITGDDGEEREYDIPRGTHINVQDGDRVRAGEALMDGPLNPHDILRVLGMSRLQEYLVNEIQEVYRLQGVNINDKHIEVIVRQMLRWVKIKEVGDTEFLLEEQVDRFRFQDENERVRLEDGEVAQAEPLLLGITKASLSTDSFISAASFQETTRVLTEAAISGRVDYLRGLKENVIMGRLIPAGTGMEFYRNVDVERDETIDQGRERDLDEFPDIVGGHDIPLPAREPLVVAASDGEGVATSEPEE